MIFDFDGLLVNSEETIYSAIKEIFLKHGHDFQWKYFLKSIGLPVKIALENYYRDFKLPIKFDEFVAERNKTVDVYFLQKLTLMPGVREILKYLNKRKILLAVATSGKQKYVNYYLNKFDILKYFSKVTTIDDVARGKPFPDLIHKTISDCGIKDKESLIIEDSLLGVIAAKKAGVKVIAVPTKGVRFSKFKNADFICKNLKEAKQKISEIIGNN